MTKTKKIIYWIATLLLSLGMFSTGLGQIMKGKGSPGGVDSMTHLGYPMYFLTILGIWKILGIIAVLIPKLALLKEWAYAGFFFIMSGAIYSHIAVGDKWTEALPSLLLLILTLISWYCRPVDRKMASVSQ